MWLPDRIYEALPYGYMIGGVLFIVGTLYVGFESTGATLYAICGFISFSGGVIVILRRRAARKDSPDADASGDP